jgi:hypothetical protein
MPKIPNPLRQSSIPSRPIREVVRKTPGIKLLSPVVEVPVVAPVAAASSS